MAGRTRHGEDFWRKHDLAWTQSGLTQVEYCAEQRIRLGSFVRWRSRLSKADSDAAGSLRQKVQQTLVPLTVIPDRVAMGSKGGSCTPPSASAREPALVIVLDAGWRLEVGATADPALLSLVLSTLQRLAR